MSVNSFSILMQSISAPSAARVTSGINKVKVKVVNTDSYVKKMGAIVNTANKHTAPGAQPPAGFKTAAQDHTTRIPQKSIKKTKVESAGASANLNVNSKAISSAAADTTSPKSPLKKRIRQPTVHHSTTTTTRLLKKEPADKQDDFDVFFAQRDTLLPKVKKPDEDSEHRNQAIARAKRPRNVPNTNTTRGAKPVVLPSRTPVEKTPVGTVPTLAQCLSLQRMQDDALTTLQQRRQSLQVAFVALSTLEEADSGPVKTAMEVLKQQSEAIDADITKLQLFGRGFKTDDIKGTDSETFVALASWGLDVEKQSTPSKDKELVAAGQAEVSLEDTSLDEAIEAELFGDGAVEEQAPSVTDAAETPLSQEIQDPQILQHSPPPVQSSLPRQRITASFMGNPKRKNPNTPLSRAPQAMGTIDHKKATETILIDPFEARQAEMVGASAEKGSKSQKSKKAAKAHSAKTHTGGSKSKLWRDDENNLRVRKDVTSSCAGEKRKRGDVVDLPHKCAAVEGRNFAPLRVRLAVPTGSVMEIDSTPAFPATASLFNP